MVIDTDVIKKALIAGTKTMAGIMKKGFIMGYTRFKGMKKSHRIATVAALMVMGILLMSSLFSSAAADNNAIIGRWVSLDGESDIEITETKFIAVSLSRGNITALRITIEYKRESGKYYCYVDKDLDRSRPLIIEIIGKDRINIIDGSNNEVYIRKAGASATNESEPSQTTRKTNTNPPVATVDDRPALIRHFKLSPTDRYVKRPNDKSTLMHYAADKNDIASMEWLLRHGWEVDLLDKEGATPLHEAASGGSLEAMKWLHANGASLRETDNEGNTIIFAAVMSDNTEVLTWLKRQVVSINERNDLGRTPAHYAAIHGSLNALKWLKHNGAKLDVKDKSGETPWDCANRMHEPEVMKWLEANGGK